MIVLIVALVVLGGFGGLVYTLFSTSRQRQRRGGDWATSSLDDDDSGEVDLIADRLERTADRFSNAGDLARAAQATALALSVKSMEDASAAREAERDFMQEVGSPTSGGTDDWGSSRAPSSDTASSADLLSGSDAGSTDNS